MSGSVADAFNPYREWLGLSEGAPGNYYELLSLALLESDPTKITAAAERATTKVRSFRPGPQARAWSQLLDEIREARGCLLDAGRKAAYDAALCSAGSFPPAGRDPTSVAAPQRPAPVNSDLYPPGMISQPIPVETDSQRHAEQPSRPRSDLDPPARLAAVPELTVVFDPLANAGGAYPPAALDPMAPVAIPALPLPGEESQSLHVVQHSGAINHATAMPQPALAVNARNVMSAPEARKSPWNLLLVGLGGGLLVVLVAEAYVVVSRNRPPADATVPQTQLSAEDEPHPTAFAGEGTATKPEQSLTRDDPNAVIARSGPQTPPLAEVARPALAPPQERSPEPPPAPATETPPRVTRAEVEALAKALTTAKQALGDQNFSQAAAELAKAESLARLPRHREMVARLKEVAKLVEQFRDAIVAAVQEMEVSVTFTVGSSTQVLFVEKKPDRVTLRLAGMNRTYLFNDLPTALGIAIADLKLAGNDPASRAVKGAYLLVHKKADADACEKARSWWQEAQAGGVDMGPLMPFLNDHYEELVKEVGQASSLP